MQYSADRLQVMSSASLPSSVIAFSYSLALLVKDNELVDPSLYDLSLCLTCVAEKGRAQHIQSHNGAKEGEIFLLFSFLHLLHLLSLFHLVYLYICCRNIVII